MMAIDVTELAGPVTVWLPPPVQPTAPDPRVMFWSRSVNVYTPAVSETVRWLAAGVGFDPS